MAQSRLNLSEAAPLAMPLLSLALLLGYMAERSAPDLWQGGLLTGAALLYSAALWLAVSGWRAASGHWPLRAARAALLAAYLHAGLAAALLWWLGRHWQPGNMWLQGALFLSLAYLLLFYVLVAAMEWALLGNALGTPFEAWRFVASARGAVGVVLAGLTLAALNVAILRLNRQVDLSYFKLAVPSASTQSLAQQLSSEVEALLFFPEGNDVGERLRTYFSSLAVGAPRLQVQFLDAALAPEQARTLQIRSNGYLLLRGNGKQESYFIGLELNQARDALRRLDVEVQRRLLHVARPPRRAYVTLGHGERELRPAPTDLRAGLKNFAQLLETQGFNVMPLGPNDGLSQQVPPDADLVAIMGPTAPFSMGEYAALQAYLQGGGRLWLALDPRREVDSELATNLLSPTARAQAGLAPPLAELLGLTLNPYLLENERYAVRLPGTSVGKGAMLTTRAANHPATKTLYDNPTRLAAVLLDAGYFTPLTPGASPLHLQVLLRSMPGTRSLQRNPKTGAAAYTEEGALDQHSLGLAVESLGKGQAAGQMGAGRGLAFSSVDMFCDLLLRNPGNTYLTYDALRWLMGDEALAGAINNEEDVLILHRREDDLVWFYGACFGLPLLLLASGLLWLRRRRSASL